MRAERLMHKTLLSAAIALLSLPAAGQKKTTGSLVSFGSVSGMADRARYELRSGIITYTGNVDVKTDKGDTLSAAKVVLTLNKERTDVQIVSASGGVSFAVRKNVAARKDPKTGKVIRPAYVRSVQSRSSTAALSLGETERNLVVQGKVTGQFEDLNTTSTFGAEKAVIGLSPQNEATSVLLTGGASLKLNQKVEAERDPATGTVLKPAYERRITAQSNTAELEVATQHLVLTGNVAGRSEEADFIATFRGANVDVNMTTGVIDAQGSPGNRAEVTYATKPAGKE